MKRYFELINQPRNEKKFMLDRIKATVPVLFPGEKGVVNSNLVIDAVDGSISIDCEDFGVANYMLELIQVNNVIAIDVVVRYIAAKPADLKQEGQWPLSANQQQMADKLTDTGIEQVNAEMWVRRVVGEGRG